MFGISLYSSLNKSQKEIVTLRQQQMHQWWNDHLHQRIFASERQSVLRISVHWMAETVQLSSPMQECRALLSLPAFQTVISKSQPSDKN